MNNVIVRLSQISEDVIRLFKKVSKQAAPSAPDLCPRLAMAILSHQSEL
jgi:hypothetical protein